MSTADGPQVVYVTILDKDETMLAAVAVRKYLTDLRCDYRVDIRRGKEHYAAHCVEKFDKALDLYERLGGDVDQVPDIEAPPKQEKQ